MPKPYPFITMILLHEAGELEPEATAELLEKLEESGLLYHLQGSYQREYRMLREAGKIFRKEVDEYAQKATSSN